MKQFKILFLASVLTLFSTYSHALPVNMAPIITYLLSDTAIATPQEIAIAKIKAYADNQANPVPALQDYADAGVTGVTVVNINSINSLVASLTAIAVDTTVEIQAIINSTLANSAPVANAGLSQNINTRTTVTLDGSGSSDSNLNPLTYAWSITSQPPGSTATLSNASIVNPTFTPDVTGPYVLQLIVNDGFVNSASDTVTITATTAAPVAYAGLPQTVQVNQSITITGTATDSDGTIVSYRWTKDNTILATTAVFTYTPDTEGTDTLTLTVTDNDGATASASIEVKVVRHNVNYVWIASYGSPIGTFWYLGEKKWERVSDYDCVSFTETGRDESSIFLTDSAGIENLIINLDAKTITSNQDAEILEVLESGIKERSESWVTCPSTSNDYTPAITSAVVTEVNSGRTMVLTLKASDADFPGEVLSFSLTNNPQTDNNLFKISNFSEKARAACRAGTANEGNPEDPNNANYFIVEDGVNSLEECQVACNTYPLNAGFGSCKGVEYRAEGADLVDTTSRCELWKTPIVATVPQSSYTCYTRVSEIPSVLSFINAPDFRIPLDRDVNNIYEVEVEVSDGVHSSTQILEVTMVPNGDYIGRSGTACRAGTQNEGNPEDPDNLNYFTITNGVNSLEDCQALCDAYPLIDDPSTNCMGVEYRVEGADYADTKSRCELWKVPIVATTPQKEYACYIRDLLRSDYGPDISAYIGDYKTTYINENNESAIRTMTLSQQSPSELLWTEGANSWSISRTADRNKLNVGSNYPYTGDGYEEPEVFWDADEVAGIRGPDGLIYRTDWADAKLSQSQALYREYINNHSSDLSRVIEAERQIRELKWAIAEQINTAQAYRDYKNNIGTYYGRTQEADKRIGSFKAFVTAEVLQIEVDENVPAIGENNDLELFYNLEFAINSNHRADSLDWSADDVILASVMQNDGSKITNINDGADRAFIPTGDAEKTVEATENLTLRYGGLMFEIDSFPVLSTTDPTYFFYADNTDFQQLIDDCNWYGPGDYVPSGSTCESLYGTPLMLRYLFSNTSVETNNAKYPVINGIFSRYWNGYRTWAGNAVTATASLNSSYFTIALADMEYEVPKVETKSIKFANDEEIRIKYEITKRTEEQHNEYISASTLSCEDPVLKNGILKSRFSVDIDPPGFLIRNETDQTYSVSLNQVGPMYYGEVPPGQIFKRDTPWGHFTIDTKLNMTGEQRYSDWNVAAPIVQFTAEVLFTAITAGTPISSIKATITAGVKVAGTKLVGTTAVRAGLSALGRTAFGRAVVRAGAQAIKLSAEFTDNVLIKLVKEGGSQAIDYGIDAALDEAFVGDLADLIYNEEATGADRTWSYSGNWPGNVGVYHIVGGPRLPCLAQDGNLEIRSRKLEILNDEECAARPDICTLR